MLMDLCISELEDVAREPMLSETPQSVVQESPHPYPDDFTMTNNVRMPGEALSKCQVQASACQVGRCSHARLSGVCMPGRTLFICQVQQCLHTRLGTVCIPGSTVSACQAGRHSPTMLTTVNMPGSTESACPICMSCSTVSACQVGR